MARNPEQQLLSSIIATGDPKTAMAHGVSETMFNNYSDEWLWVLGYQSKYGKSPSRMAFKRQFPDFVLLKTSNETDFWSDEVRRSYTKHLLVSTVNRIADSLADDDIDTAIKTALSDIIRIAASTGTEHDGNIFASFDDVIADVESRVTRASATGSSGIPTGISAIDDETGGSNPGELLILGARLGSGKSWVMQYMGAHAAAAGYNVQFDALEQTRAQVTMRIHNLLSSSVGKQIFQSAQLMKGKGFSLREYKKFVYLLKTSMKGQLHVSDTSRGMVSTTTIMSQIERNNPDIVFVDYITLLAKSGPDWQGVAQLSSELKSLAGRYQIPIWAASQLNRADGNVRNGIPGTEALSQSDAIGQDADMVVTQRLMSARVIGMMMAKYRNGHSGFKWYMHFEPDTGTLKQITYGKAMDLQDEDKDRASQKEEEMQDQ